jgi:hypothetical protein
MIESAKKLILLHPESLKKLIQIPSDLTQIESKILKIIGNKKLNNSQRLASIANLLFFHNRNNYLNKAPMKNEKNTQTKEAETNTEQVLHKSQSTATDDLFSDGWSNIQSLNNDNNDKMNPFASIAPRSSDFSNFIPQNLYEGVPMMTSSTPSKKNQSQLDLSAEKRDFINNFNEIAQGEDIRDLRISDNFDNSYLTGTSKATGLCSKI